MTRAKEDTIRSLLRTADTVIRDYFEREELPSPQISFILDVRSNLCSLLDSYDDYTDNRGSPQEGEQSNIWKLGFLEAALESIMVNSPPGTVAYKTADNALKRIGAKSDERK